MFVIFNDIKDFKEFVGGGANVSVEMKSIKPIISIAAETHLRIWLNDFWDLVQTNPTSYTALLPIIKSPLAMLTMYENSKIHGVQVSESGLHRMETDRLKSAFKYQENSYRKFMLEHGYEAIERMLIYLEKNESTYPAWQGTEGYKRNKSLFINTAADFRKNYANYLSRYTFEILRAVMEDIECFAILPLLGQPFYDELKDAILLKAENDIEKQLIKIIQRSVANFTIEEGIKRSWVRIEGRNVIQSETLGDQGYEKTIAAKNDPTSEKLRHHQEWGDRHSSKITHFLNTHIDQFPTYKTWLESQEPEETPCTEEFHESFSKTKKRAIARF